MRILFFREFYVYLKDMKKYSILMIIMTLFVIVSCGSGSTTKKTTNDSVTVKMDTTKLVDTVTVK